MRVYVHSRRELDAALTRSKFDQGLEPEPAAYGFNLAETRGLEMSYSDDRPHIRFSDHLFWKLGFDFLHAVDNLAKIRRADVIWTMLEWEWLSVSLLQRLRLAPRRPLVANSVWLAERWTEWSWIRRAVYQWLMADNLHLTVHAALSHERLKQLLPRKEFHLVRFGVSTRGYPLTPPRVEDWTGRPIRVYSIGNDGTRDWETMLEAFGGDPRFEVAIVCRWLGDEHLKAHSNLRIPRIASVADQREMYGWADVVVMPMRPNCFSGITVLLEAAALGRPIVSSRTGGAETYFNDDEVTYVPPGDAAALKRAVLEASRPDLLARAVRAQARFVADGYSAQDMVERYVALTETLTGRRLQ